MRNLWIEGVIGIPDARGGHSVGVWYQAKVYDEPSEFGINGGRISKLQLRVGKKGPFPGTIVANYDRGWDVEPQGFAAEAVLAILLDYYK